MQERLRFLLNRIHEKLWVKPLLFCILSIAAALLARAADGAPGDLIKLIPDISRESIEDLLKITAASMLVIATLSVSTMVSAYASAGNTATPRTFPLIIADDMSQNALSIFIGAFIFSVVALVALMNGYYAKPGRFFLFALTLVTLAIVIITFLRWVDKIARLSRLGTIIDKVEVAAAKALQERRLFPTLRAVRLASTENTNDGSTIFSSRVGYVQQIDLQQLQCIAEENGWRIKVTALPGTFATPDRPLAFVIPDGPAENHGDHNQIEKVFVVGQDRLFDQDPRFGLVVLSEIAARALSPAVNDPGTAIDIIGTYVRLFTQWCKPVDAANESTPEPEFNRIYVSELRVSDMFDDAFTAIARDGAGMLEVQVRLQKALNTLAAIGNDAMRTEAHRHSQLALNSVEKAIDCLPHIEIIRNIAAQK